MVNPVDHAKAVKTQEGPFSGYGKLKPNLKTPDPSFRRNRLHQAVGAVGVIGVGLLLRSGVVPALAFTDRSQSPAIPRAVDARINAATPQPPAEPPEDWRH